MHEAGRENQHSSGYRPPPAQAQAHPAQAQAQAQELPPPPRYEEEEDLGTGFVFWVMRLVKLVMLPTTSLEKFSIPVTMEAANSPPGRLGSETPSPAEVLGAAGALVWEGVRPRLKEGS